VTAADGLAQVAEAAAAAALAALREAGVDDVVRGAAAPVEGAGSALDGFELPVQVGTVDDAVLGRTTFVITQSGAVRVAALTAGDGPPDLTQLGAVLGGAAAAAAAAAARRLGSDADPAAPALRLVAEADAAEAWDDGACAVRVDLTICDEPAALVLVVPAALLEDLPDAALAAAALDGDPPAGGTEGGIAEASLRGVKVRLWVELGRTRMALGRAVGLAPGEVVELDAGVDDPVVIFVNGVRLGSGQLVVGDDGEWAFRVAEVSAAHSVHRELQGQAAHATAERTDA
jgi:flagellar motor switch protein FliN/FliY